ncbi:ribonuclease p 40kda subunit [Ophiostoma piceae UAMH 11346]|uniref:Ribonuclease p 40kda subunit n=1 Tax=Ophiostoma piceae (strain UAMH 11346) TaxID=1262450 RepID=S3CAN9_OPHP1|nr:ribonuclease p 40kda subunit [Ophiostoma piceae UAMH 11346]
MLPFAPDRSVFQETKCYFSHGTMGYIDPLQPPAIESAPTQAALPSADGTPKSQTINQSRRLRKPWSSIQALGFVSQLDLILPTDDARVLRQKLQETDNNVATTLKTAQPKYARVTMTLKQVLEGAFYTDYVQAGNIAMLSEGRVGQDNVVSLRGGHLTLYMQRQAYESAGLQGKPHGATGSRNFRPRWVVESDLSTKSMKPGQPGHNRLLQACDNVFSAPVTWLFSNMFDTPTPDPLAAFNPKYVTVSPSVIDNSGVALPPLGRPPSLLASDDNNSSSNAGEKRRRKSDVAISDSRLEKEEATTELYEWLSLVRLGSPRVKAGDDIDPYLSRYAVPGSDAGGLVATGDVSVLRWTGFFSPTWACQTLLDVVQAMQSTSSSSSAWFAASVSSFSSSKGIAGDCAECTFFRPAGAPQEYLLWDIHSHE